MVIDLKEGLSFVVRCALKNAELDLDMKWQIIKLMSPLCQPQYLYLGAFRYVDESGYSN